MVTIPTQTQDVQSPTPKTSTNNNGDQNGLMYMSVGPAALAQLLLNEIMALYAEIVKLDKKQAVDMAGVQFETAQSQAKAAEQAGKASGSSLIWAGALSTAFALGAVALQVKLNSSGSAADAKQKMAGMDNELKGLNAVDRELGNVEAEGTLEGGGLAQEEPASKTIRQQFEREDFAQAFDENGKLTPNARKALARMKARNERGEFNFDQFETRLTRRLDNRTKDYNSAANTLDAVMQKGKMASDMVNAFGSSSSNVAQGLGQSAKAVHDKDQTLDQVTSQSSGQLYGQYQGEMTKKSDNMMAAEQALDKIRQAQSTQG